MRKMKATRRATAVTAVVVAALSGFALTAPTAHAAPRLTWKSADLKDKNDRLLRLYHGVEDIGTVFWSNDLAPGSHLGDTLYLNDFVRDGYAIRGQVKQVSTGKIVIDISTAGKTAPAKKQKTKNLKENSKLKVRGCVMKGKKSYGCTSWYSARA